MEQILQLAAAFIGTVAFSVLFSVPKQYFFFCGLTGSVGWGVYLAVNYWFHTPIVATFVASTALTVLSRFLAVRCKATTTMFLLCGIFTLVPGAWIYYTAYYAIAGQGQEALVKGIESIKIAMAIGMGIGVAYSIPPRAFGWKKEVEIWKDQA